MCVWGGGDGAPAQADADSLCVLGQEEEGAGIPVQVGRGALGSM